MSVWPGPTVMVRGLSQSVPTAKTSELARVVVMLADGCVAEPVALATIAVAAPASEFAAPWNPTTVIEAVPENRNTALTVIDARAVGAKAYQISGGPDWEFSCATRGPAHACKRAIFFIRW